MKTDNFNIMNNRTFGLLAGVFLLGFGLYLIFYLYPAWNTFRKSRQDIAAETARLDRNKLLFPVMARARALEKIKTYGTLPFPRRKALKREALPSLYSRLAETALANRLKIIDNDYDLNSLERESESISVLLTLTGHLMDFRQFLIDLIALEYLKSVDMIRISAEEEDTKQMALKLDILITRGKS